LHSRLRLSTCRRAPRIAGNRGLLDARIHRGKAQNIGPVRRRTDLAGGGRVADEKREWVRARRVARGHGVFQDGAEDQRHLGAVRGRVLTAPRPVSYHEVCGRSSVRRSLHLATLEQTEASVPKRRGMGMGTIVLVAALAMLLLLAAVFTIGSLVSIRQLDAELAKLRAAGQPVTAADLDALYAFPPKERDTTELWLGAFAVLDSPAYGNDAADLPDVGEGGAVPPPGEPWPQLEAAEAFLAKYRDPLAKMHRASEPGGEARFPLTFSAGDGAVASALLPHIQHVRGAVRLLKLESEVHIRRNDPHAAAESVRAIFAAARSFERQPLFVSQLVRVAMNGVACSQIERFLPASDF